MVNNPNNDPFPILAAPASSNLPKPLFVDNPSVMAVFNFPSTRCKSYRSQRSRAQNEPRLVDRTAKNGDEIEMGGCSPSRQNGGVCPILSMATEGDHRCRDD